MISLLAFWLLTATALTFVIMFSVNDAFRVYEPYQHIRVIEIVLFSLIALLGIERMIAQIRKLRRR